MPHTLKLTRNLTVAARLHGAQNFLSPRAALHLVLFCITPGIMRLSFSKLSFIFWSRHFPISSQRQTSTRKLAADCSFVYRASPIVVGVCSFLSLIPSLKISLQVDPKVKTNARCSLAKCRYFNGRNSALLFEVSAFCLRVEALPIVQHVATSCRRLFLQPWAYINHAHVGATFILWRNDLGSNSTVISNSFSIKK